MSSPIDANTVFLKLHYLYTMQRYGINHLITLLKERGLDDILATNLSYVHSIMTPQQQKMWPLFIADIDSKMVVEHVDMLENVYSVLSDVAPSTHITEYVPPTRTVLIVQEN